MRSTQQLSTTLPNEMADMVRAKVSAGEYASGPPGCTAIKTGSRRWDCSTRIFRI